MPTTRQGQEQEHQPGPLAERQRAEQTPEDHAGPVRYPLGEDDGRGTGDRRPVGLTNKQALQDLPQLSRRDSHREPGGEDGGVDLRRHVDVQDTEVVDPPEKAADVRDEDQAQDDRYQRPSKVFQGRAEVIEPGEDAEGEVHDDAEGQGEDEISLHLIHIRKSR